MGNRHTLEAASLGRGTRRARSWPLALALLVGTFVPGTADAQRFATVSRRPLPPPLLVAESAPKDKQLRLTKVDVDVRIVGHLAETRTTVTFYNPNSRNLEGDLYFPLPDGATVSGYALDIKGSMVDGVVVPKAKARQVFEAEVRKGIDPGLVEWTRGNNFKTRVFPIPARGTRTIRIDYVSDVDVTRGNAYYHLPLAYKKRVRNFTIRVEVVGTSSKPTVVSSPTGLSFSGSDAYVARAVMRNATPRKDLRISLPMQASAAALVERGADGNYYFSIRDRHVLPSLRPAAARPKPRSVNVYWDASRSRTRASHKRELAVLRTFLSENPRARVTVYLLRNSVTPLRIGSGPSIVDYLSKVDYDGATNLKAMAMHLSGSILRQRADLNLVFTDGVANYGGSPSRTPRAPTWVFSSTSTANHVWMRQLAASSGGAYLNLQTQSSQTAAASIGRASDTVRATASAGSAEMFPSRPSQVEDGAVTIAGRLMGQATTVTLAYRNGEKRTIRVSRSGAKVGNVLRRYYAQKKLQELLVDERGNADAIRGLGQEYGLVTPGTSLMVLERLDQYVQYKIRPPASSPKMRLAYDQQAKRLMIAEGRQRKSKIERVVSMWQEHVKWWNTRFTYRKPKMRAKKMSRSGGRRFAGSSSSVNPSVAMEVAAGAANPDGDGESDDEAPAEKSKNGSSGGPSGASISMKPWNPQTPYLKALKSARGRYATYVAQRKVHGDAPAFYVDVAEYYFQKKNRKLAVQILSNLAELGLEEPALLRVLAHKLGQVGELDAAIAIFEEVLTMRPEEPQSYRDLALVLAARAVKRRGSRRQADYKRALSLLGDVVVGNWARFDRIEIIALTEMNNIWPKARAAGLRNFPIDKRLKKHLTMDVRIVMTWDADLTDMDLHVVEPTGEEAYYSHNLTGIGGKVSRDFTQGYGPEVYSLRRAKGGVYTVKTKYFGSRAAKLAGGVTLQVEIFTDYGRPSQKRKTMTLRLTENKEMFTVGSIKL